MSEAVEKRRRYGFVVGLGIFFLVMLLATAGVMCYLWRYLERFEAGTPTAAVQRYIDLLVAEDYDQIYETSGFQTTEFSGKKEYIAHLKKLYQGDLSKAVYLKKESDQKDLMIYEIHIDDKLAATLELTPVQGDGWNKWQANTRVSFWRSLSVRAPAHVDVMVNGKVLDKDSIIKEDKVPWQYKGVHTQEYAPKLVECKVDGLLDEPVVTAQKKNGETCKVADEHGGLMVSAAVDESGAAEKRALMEKVAKTYAAFISKDATATELHQYLLKDTDFYDAIKNFYNGWYIEHDSFEYRDLKHSELEEFSENDFTGEVSFDYIIRKGHKEYVYESRYELSFLNIDGKWVLANLATR